MEPRRPARTALIIAGLSALHASTAGAVAQCEPFWQGYAGPHLDAPIFALTTWDPDGAGPLADVVVAGGNFHNAGATDLNFVGMWDGNEWRAMGTGVSGSVLAATSYTPPGSGPQPVIGGVFSLAGSEPVNAIARFDGTQWLPFKQGLTIPGSTFNPTVYALGVHQDWLLAGGLFTQAGSVPAQSVARWDGLSWEGLPPIGIPNTWHSEGAVLYAGGYFAPPISPNDRTGILRWTGSTWETVGSNYPRWDVYALSVYRGDLYAGGSFTGGCCGTPTGPGDFIARYDGAQWVPVGGGLNATVRAMIVHDADGSGPQPEMLYVGGGFNMAGGRPVSGIAAWDGSQWHALGDGTSGTVRAMTIWRGQLAVGGQFVSAGGITSPGLAIWGCPPAPCRANCDQSAVAPILNVDDFTCFINEYASASVLPLQQQVEHYANCDGSTSAPILNVDDFTCFINEFAAGCR
jgi:hypothetical protein